MKEYLATIYDMSYLDTEAAESWAREHCKSFSSCEHLDLSDLSPMYDSVSMFVFTNEKELMWFKLRWQHEG